MKIHTPILLALLLAASPLIQDTVLQIKRFLN